MKTYGLVGYPLAHSASPRLFQQKFETENITGVEYRLFPLEKITEIPRFVNENADLAGFNVTSPYKEEILPYLTRIDEAAASIGAVNTVKVIRDNGTPHLLGFNTDYIGFAESLMELTARMPKRALVLGTGGAAKAAIYALSMLRIPSMLVSRNKEKAPLTYSQLTRDLILKHLLIVNATPVGMFPDNEEFPDIPYEFITPKHILFDMIYNPEMTAFLEKGRQRGAEICNGAMMLQHQAEASWNVWNNPDIS